MNSKNKTTGTKDDVKAELVPKLRFPEFVDTEGWESKRLGSVGELTRGLTYSSADVASAGLLVLRSTNIQDGSLVLDKDLVFVGKPIPGALRLQAGDIVICMSNGSKTLVGKSSEYFGEHEGDITVGAFCSFFRPRLPFAKFAFHLGSYQAYIANLIAGGSINNLTNFVLEEFIFQVPRLTAEQQKIADCLSSLDELIAAQARKVDALKTHKKGLVQQLFPREGETQPCLRFPEFRHDGEWQERKAGSLFVSRTTKGEDGLPIYSVTKNDGMVKRNSLDRKIDDIEEAIGNKKVLQNDIAYNMMRMWQGALGVAPEDCLVSPAYVVLAPKKDTVPLFFQYMFKQPEMLLLLTAHSRGLTKDRLRLYFDDFARMEFRCPNVKEQQRIAEFLASLDALINSTTQKLEALKTHKKGLMQQLFPSVGGVAGEA